MKGASDLLAGLTDCSTGGQRETLERFHPFMSALVEGIVEGTRLLGVRYDEGLPSGEGT